MDTQVTKGSKIFFLVVCIIGFASIATAYYRYAILHDFTITGISTQGVI